MSRTLVALASILAIAGPALAADRTIPYADMHGMFERIARLEGGKYLKATAKLSSADPGVPTESIRLVIQSRQGDIAVPIGADGATRFPVRDDLLRENPPVLTNVPEGKLQLNLAVTVEADPVERFRYRLLVEMLEEAKTILGRQGLLARMMLPDFEDLAISFPAGAKAAATVELPGGAVRLEADAAGSVRIPDRRDWRRQDPWIQLSELPQRIALRAD